MLNHPPSLLQVAREAERCPHTLMIILHPGVFATLFSQMGGKKRFYNASNDKHFKPAVLATHARHATCRLALPAKSRPF
ncbi:uncharacterized protein CANTADRAFT_259071 [Suhomyces tanzawaensis NRRL Y-17324]|uniref:Uncharacterized protein n=1 Tax=Suhomyces tanzawaensis NRRL Y-17324 TaxID=984487 RepID=A0A1E4SIW9_9ASCO|nr:uncharacterized protein CANTADRAFT_259071 [Suhomyces tanzawaensis NRRL Y-17324]ODV79444.1 hypothetical protein CANTADRAFT_259071 [Suhomyces tanzawaensis NRRL Y-17324]